MKLIQQLAELRTHGEGSLPVVENLPKALEFYSARIGRDLGRLHELTEGKVAVGFLVEMSTIYEDIMNKTPDDIPAKDPKTIFKEDVLSFMETSAIKVEAI